MSAGPRSMASIFSRSSWSVISFSSHSEFHHRCPGPAFILRGFGDRGHVRMFLQVLAQRLPKNTHAAAVHDSDASEAGKESTVQKFFYTGRGLVHVLANDVDLGGRGGAIGDRNRNPLGAGSAQRRIRRANDDLGDIVASDLHLHGAHLDLES